MNIYKSTVLGCVCVLLFSGCNPQAVKEEKVTAKLAPMDNPKHAVNYVQTLSKDGEALTSELVAMTDGLRHWESSNGCKYQRVEMFAPANRWQGCEATDGAQSVEAKGSPWPLSVGKRWSYAFKGQNANGYDWSGERECEVTSTARVTTSTGDVDTFKVVCDDQFTTRTYYMSPILKDYAKHVRYRKRQGETTTYEMIKNS